METPDTSIRRAPRTYGRRREPDASDVDAAFTAGSSASSNQSSPAFSESGRDVPPSSDFDTSLPLGDDDDVDDAPDDDRHMLGPGLDFDWRRKLKKIDARFNDMEDAPPPRRLESDSEEGSTDGRSRPIHDISADVDDAEGGESVLLPRNLFKRSIKDDLAQIDRQFDRAEVADPHKGESVPLFAGALDDPFGEPLPILREDPQPADTTEPEEGPSSPDLKRVARRRAVAHASDSDGEDSQAASPPPGVLHPISTPKTGSSPTPPTTEEMAKKGKGKQRQESPDNVDTDELPAVGPSRTSGKTKGKRAEKQKRVKAPTQKERVETQKTTARIKAEQTAALSREDKPFTRSALFTKLRAKADEGLPPSRIRENPSESSLSDQIEQFSSPAHDQRPSRPFVQQPSGLRGNPFRSRSTTVERQLPLTMIHPGGSSARPLLPTPKDSHARKAGSKDAGIEISSDSDSELPDLADLIRKDTAKREAQAQREKLRELKLRLAEEQQKKKEEVEVDDSSDIEIVENDMHVVAREEDEERKAVKARHARPSVGRKNQLTLAGRSSAALSPSKASPLGRARPDLRVLQAAAAPLFSAATRMDSRKGKERGPLRVAPNELNSMLLKASEEQSRKVILEKEREFYRREGAPRDRMPGQEASEETKKQRMNELVQKGMRAALRSDLAEDDDDEVLADESDGEWTPAAAEEDDTQEDAGSDGDDEGENAVPEATQLSDDQLDDDLPDLPRHRPGRRQHMVLDSDQDDDDALPSPGRVLVADSSQVLDGAPRASLNHRSSVSSFSDRLEEGTDKENDARLMFDSGPDKENTIIASQESATSPLGSLRERGTLFSQDTPGPPGNLQSQQRTPLGELPAEDDDDPFLSSPTRPPRLRATESREGTPGPFRPQGERTQGLAAFFQSSLRPDENEGSQESQEECALQPAAAIGEGGGFSQFFETTQKNTMSRPSMGRAPSASAFFTPGPSAAKQSKSTLSFALGSFAQPSLRIDEERARKANDIFEKEQEAVAEHAVIDKPESVDMFVNENGFLTQSASTTLPEWATLSPTSPLFHSSSPAVQTSAVLKSAAKQRQPLGTIALSMDLGQDSDSERPRRLHKRASTPEVYRSSVSPSPAKGRSTYDVFGRKKIKAPEFDKRKMKLGKSVFVEGEAEESDEDAGFGFGITKKDDEEEEEDGEEQDKILKELVDDAAMDDDTLNELKVLEKVQEHRAQDDAADEKIARDAAEGKLRVKRRNQLLDYDDDESDEEDEDARRRRQRMAKKRRIEGDSLEQLANNPNTQAFVQAYRADMDDDNEEFAHLERDEMSLNFIGDDNLDDGEDEDEEQESHEVVTTVNLQDELRKVARGEKVVKTIDTSDVDWVFDEEGDMDEEDMRFKEVASASLRAPVNGGTSAGQMEWEPIQQSRRGNSTDDISRQQKWARGEGGSRNAGTGRASAVTGIGKSVKAGGGSLTGRRAEQGSTREKAPAKLGKAPSVLSAVSSRRMKFA
ncbi:MRC1 domain-containing protein [Phanerochaete sordida]|uniref:MRC1 domain-containing protein n=1 Tax=Phanerochaete sordida TaxID=48140 RepID=A0A9P3FXJ5_9APHY|nr:MRC1 domain-containing protein [Phanerochaete sordida]